MRGNDNRESNQKCDQMERLVIGAREEAARIKVAFQIKEKQFTVLFISEFICSMSSESEKRIMTVCASSFNRT